MATILTTDNDVSMFAPAVRVALRIGYDGSWTAGFEVDSKRANGYQLRRQSDGAVLPKRFRPDDVVSVLRPIRRRG